VGDFLFHLQLSGPALFFSHMLPLKVEPQIEKSDIEKKKTDTSMPDSFLKPN